MTPEMIARARGNAAKLGFANVEFRLGEIEHLPVEAGSVDVVISNCVLNLVPDKAPGLRRDVPRAAARRPVLRLRHRGHRRAARRVREAAGALRRLRRRRDAGGPSICALLEAAGFRDVAIVEAKPIELPDEALRPHMPDAEIAHSAPRASTLKSVTVIGEKPAE